MRRVCEVFGVRACQRTMMGMRRVASCVTLTNPRPLFAVRDWVAVPERTRWELGVMLRLSGWTMLMDSQRLLPYDFTDERKALEGNLLHPDHICSLWYWRMICLHGDPNQLSTALILRITRNSWRWQD